MEAEESGGSAPGLLEMSNNVGDPLPLINGLDEIGDIDENWHLFPIANDEALPLPDDPNVVAKLELLDSKYYHVNGVNDNHLDIKRDRHLPISIKSSRMYQSYLVGLVHTASGMDNKPIVSKNGGPAFDTNIGIKKILSTASHGNIHVMQVLKKDFSLK